LTTTGLLRVARTGSSAWLLSDATAVFNSSCSLVPLGSVISWKRGASGSFATAFALGDASDVDALATEAWLEVACYCADGVTAVVGPGVASHAASASSAKVSIHLVTGTSWSVRIALAVSKTDEVAD
jgi:hypothetical protein